MLFISIMNTHISVEAIPIDDILQYDKAKYNSNNHWIDHRPDDYFEKISNSNTKNWIHLFAKSNGYTYQTITIQNSYHLNWMKKANEIGQVTGTFSNLFEDELNEFITFFYSDPMNEQILPKNNTQPFFIRTENVSLKYGQHGIGPYYNIRQIIESLVSSKAGHTPIYPDTTEITLYFIPFNDKINDSNEWRVFVNNNKITAISQQACYSVYQPDPCFYYLENINLILQVNAEIIVDHFESIVRKNIHWLTSYTYDFALYYDTTTNLLNPFFIELNSFGAQYAAGSSLFHWLLDENKLYGHEESNVVYLRYVEK